VLRLLVVPLGSISLLLVLKEAKAASAEEADEVVDVVAVADLVETEVAVVSIALSETSGFRQASAMPDNPNLSDFMTHSC
jgi:hypothetical protein